MKPLLLISLFILPFVTALAQEKNFATGNKKDLPDTSVLKKIITPGTVIIKIKDLDEIKKLNKKQFVIIDDTSDYTEDELAGGLSAEELAAYKKNKNETIRLLVPPPPEDENYPAVSKIRKILEIAKTAGVIIILILSIL